MKGQKLPTGTYESGIYKIFLNEQEKDIYIFRKTISPTNQKNPKQTKPKQKHICALAHIETKHVGNTSISIKL